MKMKKIKDCLPLVNGIWSKIDYQFPDIFEIDSSQLDVMFLSNWSMRTVAPIINVIHTSTDSDMLTQEELITLAGIINAMFKHKWDKMMAVAEMEYDPIHNFSDHLVEEIEYGEEVDKTKSSTGSSNSTRTDNLTETETDARSVTENRNLLTTGTENSETGVYGFNSVNSVGQGDASGNSSTNEGGSITTTRSGNLTTTNSGTQANAGSNTYSETGGDDTTGQRTREYTKTGNIGNISTQKLLNEELDLWRYNFILEIMRDVANFVSLPIYEQ